eukprot:CCRYP_000852-RA/>CCRYP_000852-RA protein AED:0.03 eAED:0.03 QI:454/0.9/0.90/1/0.7/0.72/11/722/2116
MSSRDATIFMAWCRAIFCVYVVASIPWRLAFCPEFALSIVDFPGFLVTDLVATVFFTYDTIISVKQKVIVNRQVLPETVQTPKYKISKNSLLHVIESDMYEQFEPSPSWSDILIRLVSTLPFELISGFGFLAAGEWPNYLMTNRMLRLIYLPRYLNELSTELARRGYIKNIGVRRTWLLFFTMALAGHLSGSLFYLIARREALSGIHMSWPEVAGIYSVESVTDRTELKMKKSALEAYITSLYWAYTTMVTTGFGDIVPLYIQETIWCILSMFVGVLITTLSIANLQLLVTNLDASRLNFQQKIELIKKFIHHRKLPAHLQDRMLSFYDYQWAVLKGADEGKFLAELPRTLQQQVTNFMCRDIIASLPILRNANNALLNALVECAEMNIYSPNDEIVKSRERPRGAILVAHGEVEILKGEAVERKMKRLDSFAEECLFVDKLTSLTVRSKGFSEIILIPSVLFQKIIAAQCEPKDIDEMRERAIAISKSTDKANKMFGSVDDVTPSDGFLKHCHPNSFFRKIWNCLVLSGHIFYLFSIPLSLMSIVDNEPFHVTPVLLSLGYFVDAFFVVDTVFELQYFMYMDEGLIVFDKNYIHKHYFQRRSVLREFTGLLPFDLIIIFFEGKYCHYCRLLKIVRAPNILLYTESIGVILSELKVEVDLSFIRVIKLNLVMLLVCHWVGCCWYMMARLSMHYEFDQNWIWTDENNDLFTVKHSDFNGFGAYLRSVYWAIVGMSTGKSGSFLGYGDIVPKNIIETTYSTVIILFGGLFLPAVVGGLAAYMSNFRFAWKVFRKKLSKTRRYLIEEVNLGDDAIEKIISYYNHNWSRQGGVVDQEIMDELSTPLRTYVASYINESTISSAPFFSRCDETTKQLILSALQHRQFIPSDVIVEEGVAGNEMFFLHRGEATATVAYMPKIPFRIFRSGDYFGEGGLLRMSPTNFETVTASMYCECFSLARNHFDEALEGSSIVKDVKADIANFQLKSIIKSKKILQNISQHSKCIRLTVESELVEESSSTTLKSAWVLPPTSTYYLIWNCFLFAACVYNAWTIPFRLAFKTSLDSSTFMDWVFDMLFLLDMLVNYRCVGFTEDGEVITDIGRIKRNYMLRRFKTDILSSFPFYLIVFRFWPRVSSTTIGFYIRNMLRVLKLLRFPRYFGVIEKVFAVLQDKNIPLAPMRLVEFFGGVIFIAHFAACGFFTFARWNKKNCSGSEDMLSLGCQWDGTWIKRQIYNGKLPAGGGEVWQQYIRSFNWALPTLVVVVIGDVVPTTSPETLYAFLWMFIGMTINASIIGNVANIVANLESEQNDFATKVDEIKRYMFRHHLSYDLHSKVDAFTRYLWIAHKGSTNDDDFILRLPHSLRTITLQRRLKHIQNCPFFDFCSSDIVDSLSMCMRPLVFCAGDTIAHSGDMGQEMFFLERGKVIVVSSDRQSTVFATLGEGSYFGETSLFFKQPRATAVKAVTFCDVLELLKKDLFSELKRRDFNLMQMLETFAIVHEDNKRRNKAIQDNLQASKKKETKLNRMIDAETSTSAKKRTVLCHFMPGTRFRFLWDVLCTVFIIYFSVVTIFRFAFRPVEDETMPLVLFDFIVDVFFCVDFYLRSSHFAFPEHGIVTTQISSIRRHYMENGMLLDLASCASLIDVFSYKAKLMARFKLRLFCLLRVLRIPSFFNLIADHLSLRDIRISLASNLLCRIIFFYAIANHWVACLWFIIHRELERDEKFTWATTDCPWDGDAGGRDCTSAWDDSIGKHNVCNLSMIDCYVRSLHFAITTLSTVGYGDVSPVTELETIWENVVVLMGACFSAGLIGSMLQLLSQNDTMGANSFSTKVQKLKEYMAYRKLPSSLQNNILYFHHCRWQDSQTKDERETLSLLPEPLQLEISFAVKQRIIQLVPILKEQPKIVQKRLCNALRHQVYPPNSIIYSVGELGWEIYFIASGVVTIVLPNDLSELDTAGRDHSYINTRKFQSIGLMLGRGNHVGESCLKSASGVRQESVIAKSKTEMYVISKDDLNTICMFMEPSKAKALIQALLTKNGNCWHTFEDICNSNEIDNTSISELDFSMFATADRERQISGNLASFPWNTARHMGSVGTNSRAVSVMTQRRLSGARLREYTTVSQQHDP